MFGDYYYPVEPKDGDSLVDSPDEESYHKLLFIHNHTFFHKGSISPNWIILETGSSIDVFCNPSLLKNIHRSEKIINIHYSAGFVNVTHKGALPGYGLLWFARDGISNTFSIANATNKYPISYDISVGDKSIL